MRFRLKMMLCIVWVLALGFGLGGSLLISQSFANMLKREKQQLHDTYRMTVQTLQLVSTVSAQQDFSSISGSLKQMSNNARWVALVLSQDDAVIYQYGLPSVVATDQKPPTDTPESVMTVFQAAGGQYLQLTGKLLANDQPLQLSIVTEVTAVFEDRARQQQAYRGIFGILLLSGGLLAYLISGVLTRPLREVSVAARKMAKGELTVRLKPHSHDEVGQLARDFNYMAGRLESNITQLQETMEQQEQFMGSFAHELKTPMTSIIGYADLLRTQSLSEEDAMEAENYIFSEGKRLEALSLKLLELLLMKNQELQLVNTEPGRLISSLVEHLRPVYAEKNLQLQCRCEPGSCPMEPDLIKSLLVNLLDNARKAMDEGGRICIISDWESKSCRIRVIDNGRGMPPEAIAHVTEAFYRVDKARSRSQGGAGLGLTLCSRIASLHGGTIRFESRPGEGTCVTVLLGGGAAD